MITFDDLLHMKCSDYLNLDLEQKTTDEDAAIVLGYAQSLWIPDYAGLDVMVEKDDDAEYYLVVDTRSMRYSDAVARFHSCDAGNNFVMVDFEEWDDVRDLFTEDEWENLKGNLTNGENSEELNRKAKLAVTAMAIRDYINDYF